MVRGRTALVALSVIVLCVWCGWISGFHRTSDAAEITWVASLAAVVVVDVILWRGSTGRRFGWQLPRATVPWPHAGRGGSWRALQGVGPWLALILVALAWDILGIDTGPHQYHLTISALSQAYRPLNAAVVLIWILVGVGFEAARVRAPSQGECAHAGLSTASPGDSSGASVSFGACVLGTGASPHQPALLLPSSPPVGVAFWIAVPLAAVAIDLGARRTHGTVATAEEFVRFISTSRVASVFLVVAWAFAGYHLFAR